MRGKGKYNLKTTLASEVLYNIGSGVKYRRKRLKIMQKDFADLVEMDKANYCRFENGMSNISLLQYYDIIDMLDFLERRYLK